MVNESDLKKIPFAYPSTRAVGDVLIDEDTAAPLIEACSSADPSTLQDLLSQPQWTAIALHTPHRIYSEMGSNLQHDDSRKVLARPMSNLEHALDTAARSHHAQQVSVLLTFATQQGQDLSSLITRPTVDKVMRSGDPAVLSAWASAYPQVVNMPIAHGTFPLDIAANSRRTAMVARLLELGADALPNVTDTTSGSYLASRLSKAARSLDSRMTEMLLNAGLPIAGSGALHTAASHGTLDTMQLLIDRGADVNEQLPSNSLPVANRALLASWTPMHFAATGGPIPTTKGRPEAVELLQSNGARIDLRDINGKTPMELLEESR